jgi:pSer/pThr/pTyr-binding forkhead associated (FHA) protein
MPPPAEVSRTGMTTIVEVRTRLPEGRKVALVAMKGPVKGRVFHLTRPEIVLGRTDADLVLADDRQVSNRHCSIEVRDTVGILRDLGSTNGTFVNGEAVKTARLEHLSEFRVGATTLMFTVTKAELE